MSVKLFIPAAGYGTRLMPLTTMAPKPLLPINGITMVQRVIEKIMSQVELSGIGINTHYKPESVEAWRQSYRGKEKIKTFFEAEILGTGGALKNAESWLADSTFVVANGDVLSDTNWEELLRQHKAQKNLVTLAVQDRQHERRIGVDKNGKLCFIDTTEKCTEPGVHRWYGYACAAVYEPEFLKYLPQGESHVVPYWLAAAKETGRVGVYDIGKDTYWFDLGTPDNFVQAVQYHLNGEKRFLKKPLEIPYDCKLSGQIVVEDGVRIGRGVSLNNVILLPGSSVADGSQLENSVVGAGFCLKTLWDAPQNLVKSLHKIGQGGSDRVYTRCGDKVILHYSAFEENIARQQALTLSMQEVGVNVPAIYSHNPFNRTVELMDLGDVTLQQWAADKTAQEQQNLVNKTLEQLHLFQFAKPEKNRLKIDKIFDYTVLRWETSYFLERFVKRVCGLDEDFTELNKEFDKLAKEIDAVPKKVMHRDFQSTNVMIYQNKPWIIDFQSAHLGPPHFDLVSFLRDPYISYTCDSEALARDYLKRLAKDCEMNEDYCVRIYNLCGMQRHMQALGAYGFLTHIRGKDFMKHCRPAFHFLRQEVASLTSEFPHLQKLLDTVENRF